MSVICSLGLKLMWWMIREKVMALDVDRYEQYGIRIVQDSYSDKQW